ncbi:MAG: 1-deoxy-D-xylulose-5-phosphate reductoisomerase [Candidatus Gracilibacteria bacterium]
MPRRILILGSTGSIGTQALEVVRREKGAFKIVGLSANKNAALLKKQAQQFQTDNVLLTQDQPQRLSDFVRKIKADLVLIAVSGQAGIFPLRSAIEQGRNIALANKEALVMEGGQLMKLAKKTGAKIIPVDSEHAAIFQCLQSVKKEDVAKIILTCSGGPFWRKSKQELKKVTARQALKHPVWKMGNKISIDSATLMNKGFEIIEAHHLFGFDYDQIEVLIHPQGVVHGMVQLKDGNMLMHASCPDMKIPIHFALHYPDRATMDFKAFKFSENILKNQKLEFFSPDQTILEGINLTKKAVEIGGDAPAHLVEANEKAVQEFLNGEIGFLEIYKEIKFSFSPYRTKNAWSAQCPDDRYECLPENHETKP